MIPQHAGNAGGLEQEPLELGKDGAMPVYPVVDLVAVSLPLQDADVDEPGKLALDRPVPRPYKPDDLPQVKCPAIMSEEKPQHGLAGLAQQGRGQRVKEGLIDVYGRTHI